MTKGLLFVAGGYATRFGALRSVLRMDRGATGRWRPEEGLLERREGHACVGSDVDEGIVYAIGGANAAAGPLSSTERARLYFDGHGEVQPRGPGLGCGPARQARSRRACVRFCLGAAGGAMAGTLLRLRSDRAPIGKHLKVPIRAQPRRCAAPVRPERRVLRRRLLAYAALQ